MTHPDQTLVAVVAFSVYQVKKKHEGAPDAHQSCLAHRSLVEVSARAVRNLVVSNTRSKFLKKHKLHRT